MRFAAGFLAASLLWGGVFWGYTAGLFDAEAEVEPATTALASDGDLEPDPSSRGKRRRRPRRGGQGGAQGRARQEGQSSVGDDIGWDDGQRLDMAAGEQQLNGAQIEAGFDSAMPRIRRCLVLVPAEGELTGQLTFGMRVGSDGKARAVNLAGPSMVVSGESGQCLRSAAQGIRFATYDGPDSLFKYPVTLH